MHLSIVIPTLNEEQKISHDVEENARFLHENGISGEIIVVDDGSTDNTAKEAENVKIPPDIKLNVIHYTPNRGKGYAVRTGMKETHGDYAMFADSGLCVPLGAIKTGLNLMQSGTCDIAHASRRHPLSVIKHGASIKRKILSLAFRTLIPPFMGIRSRITDTQCGFKMYRGPEARELYSECRTNGFMFDIEIILRAERKNYKIAEFPIEWTADRDTRVRIGRTAEKMFMELSAIKRYLREE